MGIFPCEFDKVSSLLQTFSLPRLFLLKDVFGAMDLSEQWFCRLLGLVLWNEVQVGQVILQVGKVRRPS